MLSKFIRASHNKALDIALRDMCELEILEGGFTPNDFFYHNKILTLVLLLSNETSYNG